MSNWLWSLPVLVTFPWVWLAVMRLSALARGDVDREDARRLRNRGFRAMGCFQLAIALALVGLSVQQGDSSAAWTGVPALVIMGLGLIVISLHSNERW